MMTEEEARQALFDLHFNYMKHPPKERLELYDEYREKRAEIREELTKLMLEKKMEEIKTK